MEKIQKALAKARTAREQAGRVKPTPQRAAQALAARTAPQPPGPAPLPAGPASVAQAWKDLPPLEISPRRLIEQRIMTLEQGHNATPFDVMRTKIAQTMRANGWRRLAITSPSPACGKSTVALNLAFSFSRQSDTRIILGELDLRRPTLGKMLDVTPPAGIEAVLRGQVPFAKQALGHNGNLALSLARQPVRDASELLQADSVGGVLSGIEADYEPDLMIFDTPPVLANDDMMAFAPHIDCVLIIAGAESTTVKQVDICERELASQTNVMGVVLNKCRFMDDAQGYYDYA